VAAERLTEARQMTAQLIQAVRRVIRALRPIYLEDLGLVAALEMLTRDTGAALGLPIDFDASGLQRRLPTEVELSLYRMAQEMLSNLARHAQASRASVALAFGPDALNLSVHDNGRGFGVPVSPAEFASQGHFGLLGLHERAELIGARLAIRSTPGAGTTVDVTLPL
jgi:two-component system sensor histidine kinase UhpB